MKRKKLTAFHIIKVLEDRHKKC